MVATAMASAMATQKEVDPTKLMNLGIISRAFLASQSKPVILLVDELDNRLVDEALAEKDFLDFEEPYRLRR